MITFQPQFHIASTVDVPTFIKLKKKKQNKNQQTRASLVGNIF